MVVENLVPTLWEERFIRAASNFSPDGSVRWADEAVSRADSGDEEFFADLFIFASIMAPSVFRNIEILDSNVLAKAPYRFELAKTALMFIEDLARGRVTSKRVDSRRLAVVQSAAIGVLIQELLHNGSVRSVRARRGNSDVFLAREYQRVFVNYLVDVADVPGAWTINQHFLPYAEPEHEHFSFGVEGSLLSGSEATSTDRALGRVDFISGNFNYMLFGLENFGLVELTVAQDRISHLDLFAEMIRQFSKPLRIKIQVLHSRDTESQEP
jgi:hypothetical protein